MNLFPTYNQPSTGRKLIVTNVDMRFSFESLAAIAKKYVGADFDAGDICYFENNKGDRRKVLLKKNGVVIQLYWMKVKGNFIPLDVKDGEMKDYVDFFS